MPTVAPLLIIALCTTIGTQGLKMKSKIQTVFANLGMGSV